MAFCSAARFPLINTQVNGYKSPNGLALALRDFFGDYLPKLRGISPHTIASYRDSLVLLLRFVADEQKRCVPLLDFKDLDAQ